MRSRKGFFMLIVAIVLTLNNFLFAMNPKAAKPIFDWIDPFVIIGLALVFIDKILDSMKTKPNGTASWWRSWPGRGPFVRLQLSGQDGGQRP